MAENKTVPSGGSVEDFPAAVEHPVSRSDGYALLALMEAVTGQPPVMWGTSIVGFGKDHTRPESDAYTSTSSTT